MPLSTDLDIVVGLALALRRRELQMTQEMVAEAADLHRTYIARVELGSISPTVRVFFSIAHALQTTPDSLVRRARKLLEDPAARKAACSELPPRAKGRPKRAA